MKNWKVSPDAWVLVAFLALLGLASARIAATSQIVAPEVRPHRTVSSARPGGWKALRLLLEKQAQATELVREPATKWTRKNRIIVTGPEWSEPGQKATAWTEREAQAARSWVRAGGTLVLFTDEASELTRAMELGFSETSGDDRSRNAAPTIPTAALSGVRTVTIPEGTGLARLPKRAVTFLKSDGEAVGAVFALGSGRVVAVSSAGFCDNAHLASADNARLASALAASFGPKGSPVCFDEYRQGFESGKTLWQIVGEPGQKLVWQAAGVLLLLAWSAGVRFGLPAPLPPNRRLSAEYVASVGDLYRRAGARDLALGAALTRLREDIAGRTGLPLDAPDDLLARKAAAALGGTDPNETLHRVSAVLADGQRAMDAGPKEFSNRDLLTLAQRIETVRKDLGIDGF